MVDLAINLWLVGSIAIVVIIVSLCAWFMAQDWRNDIDQDLQKRRTGVRLGSFEDD